MMKLRVAVAGGIWAWTGVASATTGNALYEACMGEFAATPQQGLCLGYISGVFDTIMVMQAGGYFPELCVPNGVTNGQVRDVAYQYTKNNPKERHDLGSVLMVDALMDAFPCASK
jgi:hypothetical protein